MVEVQQASGRLSDFGAERAQRLAGIPLREVLDIVNHFEHQEQITNHPFMERLAREEPNLRHLWLLLANFQISISKNFARRLATIAGRVDDERIRCILAEQLNDEMGRGKFADAHINLFSRMMKQLEPWRADVAEDRVYGPGHNLEPRLARIYEAADVFESLGAVMAGEVFGKQMDVFIGEQFRRQSEVDVRSLEWLVLHEELEVAHANESAELAQFIRRESLDVCWRGACELSAAGWTFLDELYVLCYGAHELM